LKLIAGLGNPGSEYQDTRHNLGFVVLDELARRHGASFKRGKGQTRIAQIAGPGLNAFLAKPQTYMNLSGSAVAALYRYYKIEDLADVLVVVDDADLPLARLRLRASGSAGGHRGLRSVIESFGTDAFPRLRIGVGRGTTRRNLADFVLDRFDAGERPAVQKAIERAADAIEVFLADGIQSAMNKYNRDEGPETPNAGEPEPGA
jgi:PTH1 family peptidyl-tRNA hydrolase